MIRQVIISLLLFVCGNIYANSEDGFWNHGVGKTLKWVDQWLENGQRDGIDTLYQDIPKLNHQVYVGGYAYWQNYQMNHPFYISEKMRGPGSDINAWNSYNINAHTTQSEMEIGISWKGLCIELPIPIHNNFTWTYGLAKNGSVWGFRLRYKSMNTMKGHRYFNNVDQMIKVQEYFDQQYGTDTHERYEEYINDTRIDQKSHDVNIFFAEGYYVFDHKKFSIGAGLYADMVQKKSAGSWLAYANYFQSSYKARNLLLSPEDSYRTEQISVGMGYGYNYSINGGKLLIHGSVVPMFSLYSHLVHSNLPLGDVASPETGLPSRDVYEQFYPNDEYYDAPNNGKSFFRINAFARLAANYTFDRYVLTFLLNYRHYGYSNDLNMRIRNQEADIQFNLGIRF